MGIVDERVNLFRALVDGIDHDQDLAPLITPPLTPGRVRDVLNRFSTEPFEVISSSVNKGRIDLGIQGINGREWAVVLSVPHDHPKIVNAVQVFDRPPKPFPGAPGGFAVCLGGASSSGKSSLMRAMSERASTPWTYFEERSIGALPMRWAIWPDVGGPLGVGYRAAIRAFLLEGNQVIVSARPDDDIAEALDGIPRLFVGLVCPLEILIARQEARADRWAGLAEEGFALEQTQDGYDIRIDTSEHSPQEAADIVLRLVGAPTDGSVGVLS